LVSVLWSQSIYGQEIPPKTDSGNIYDNLESISKKRKITKYLYDLIIKDEPAVPPERNRSKKTRNSLLQKPYSAYEGKIIRNIRIETLDPFGYSITDNAVKTQNFLTRSENYLHIKSQDITIRNLLLIHQNQVFDTLLVKESERLVRSRGYVRDVAFTVKSVSKNSDSVDIFIQSLDRWSLIPGMSASSSQLALNLAENNFLGLGHDFKTGGEWFHDTHNFAYNMNYFIPNIRNSFISSSLNYSKDEFGNYAKNITIDRPFFSPFAKWAAGLGVSNEFRRDSVLKADSTYAQEKFKYNTQDYWAGKAIPIFAGISGSHRTTNLIISARYFRVRYSERPAETFNAQYKYSNENFYLTSIGISTRKYVQDNYFFKYGLTEDVPVGRVFSLTGGYQVKNQIGRIYLGARVSSGKYYSWGYLSSNFEYGTFFKGKQTEQGAVVIGINYYSRLFEIGKWKFRQFVKPQMTLGINRFSNDSLNLNEGHGLDGFKSEILSGSSRLMFTLQTQSYSPWNIIGFQFGPYINCSLGMLGNSYSGFRNSRIYSQIGLGVLIKNEKLIINTFQFSISYYPIVPEDGQNVFKANSTRSNDFGFRDFEIGKPGVVVFQ